MERSFAEAVLRWHDFYALVGSAAAGLVGLLFVSVSLHLDVITQSVGGEARALAEQTFTSFIYVLFIALLFLIPAQSPVGFGLPLVLMGVVGCRRTAQTGLQFWRARQAPERMLGSRYVWRRFAYPAVFYVALTVVSLAALRGRVAALAWVLILVMFLLLSATVNAWELMLLLALGKRSGSS